MCVLFKISSRCVSELDCFRVINFFIYGNEKGKIRKRAESKKNFATLRESKYFEFTSLVGNFKFKDTSGKLVVSVTYYY